MANYGYNSVPLTRVNVAEKCSGFAFKAVVKLNALRQCKQRNVALHCSNSNKCNIFLHFGFSVTKTNIKLYKFVGLWFHSVL